MLSRLSFEPQEFLSSGSVPPAY